MQWQRWNHHSHYMQMQQIGTGGVQSQTWLGGQGDILGNVQEIWILPSHQMVYAQGDLLGNVQEIWIWPSHQMVYAQPTTCPRKWHTQTPMGRIQTDHLISARRPDFIIINKKKKKKRKSAKLSTLVSRLKETERMWKERWVPGPC